MNRGLIAGAAAIFGLVFLLDGSVHGGKDAVSIKVVMQKAMKGGLCGKVASGKASDEEKKQLIALFTDLAQDKPPKNDDQDWKDRTKALLDAAKADDGKALKKAADCKGCHSNHK
jgi:hypothetical protein